MMWRQRGQIDWHEHLGTLRAAFNLLLMPQKSRHLGYIYLDSVSMHFDGPCLKPTDKDKRGYKCGKRAVTGGLTAGTEKAKKAAERFREAKYGKGGKSRQQGIEGIPIKKKVEPKTVEDPKPQSVKQKTAPSEPKPLKAKADKDPAKAAKPIERKAGQQSAGGPIKDQETFNYEVTRAFDQINRDYNEDDLVMIEDIRKTLGDRVSDEDFAAGLRKMQEDEVFDLGAIDTSKSFSKSKGYKVSDLLGEKHYVRPGKKKSKIPESQLDEIRDGKKTGKPPIKNEKEFEKEALKIFDEVKSEIGNEEVPIYAIRRRLGDRVTRKQFADFMFKMQENDAIQLQGGSLKKEDKDPDRSRIKDSLSTDLSGLRTYVRRLDNRKDSRRIYLT